MSTTKNLKVAEVNGNLVVNFPNKLYTLLNLPKFLSEKLITTVNLKFNNDSFIDSVNLVSSNGRDKFAERVTKEFNLDLVEKSAIEKEISQIENQLNNSKSSLERTNKEISKGISKLIMGENQAVER